MNSHPQHDMYFENTQRSPSSHRHASAALHRQPSGRFDSYGGLPSTNLYTAEDHAVQQSFMPRYTDRMNTATINSSFPSAYDPWNSYNNPQQNNTIAALGGASRMKSLAGRGRPSLPGVRLLYDRRVA
jgi:hypothetical protein